MVRTTKTTCSRCKSPLEPGRVGFHRYCLTCHREYMRASRRTHASLTPQEKLKAIARAKVNVYIKRGNVIKTPCIACGCEKVEAHHVDYFRALEVRFLCKRHHVQLHRDEEFMLWVNSQPHAPIQSAAKKRNRKGRNPVCRCGRVKEVITWGKCKVCRNEQMKEYRNKHALVPNNDTAQ